jgi:hypothetical protein
MWWQDACFQRLLKSLEPTKTISKTWVCLPMWDAKPLSHLILGFQSSRQPQHSPVEAGPCRWTTSVWWPSFRQAGSGMAPRAQGKPMFAEHVMICHEHVIYMWFSMKSWHTLQIAILLENMMMSGFRGSPFSDTRCVSQSMGLPKPGWTHLY